MNYKSINRCKTTTGEQSEFLTTLKDTIPNDQLFVATEKVHGIGCKMIIENGEFKVALRNDDPIKFGEESLYLGMEYVLLVQELFDRVKDRIKDNKVIIYFELAGGQGKNQVQPEIDYNKNQFIYIFDILDVKKDIFLSYSEMAAFLSCLYDSNKGWFNNNIIFDRMPNIGFFNSLQVNSLLGKKSKLTKANGYFGFNENIEREGEVIRGYKEDIIVKYQAEEGSDIMSYRIIVKNINPNFEEVKAQPIKKEKETVETSKEVIISSVIEHYCTTLHFNKVKGNLGMSKVDLKQLMNIFPTYKEDVLKNFYEVNGKYLSESISTPLEVKAFDNALKTRLITLIRKDA